MVVMLAASMSLSMAGSVLFWFLEVSAFFLRNYPEVVLPSCSLGI